MDKLFLQKFNRNAEVHIFNSATSALEYLDKSLHALPDLILLDIHMPVVGGFEFLQKLQKSNY